MKISTVVAVVIIMLGGTICHPNRKLDLVLYTQHVDFGLLLPLLRSFEMFFPMHLLGEFFVILDRGNMADESLGLMLPEYITVVYENETETYTSFMTIHGHVENANGHFSSQISNFFIDEYGSSEFIGILDSDVIFRTGNMESVMFKGSNPIIFCSQHRDFTMDAVRSLGVEFQHLNPFSCMENFPFVVRRDSLPKVRAFISERTGVRDARSALVKLIQGSAKYHTFGNFAMLGSYLYVFERERYHFVIGGNGDLSTCPEIRSTMHVFYAGPRWREHDRQKVHPEYFETARKAMARGACYLLCNQTETCARLIAEDPHDEELLSLESQHEMMFGTLDSLKKPECLKYIVRKIKRHRRALRRQACGI